MIHDKICPLDFKMLPLICEHCCSSTMPEFKKFQIPSVVTVESRFNGARISLVDSIAALKRLAEEHPEHFRFMLENPIEYQHAFFKASHQLANIDKNVIISVGSDFRS